MSRQNEASPPGSVNVHYHHEDGSWWAEVPEWIGVYGAADTLDELRQQMRELLPFAIDERLPRPRTLMFWQIMECGWRIEPEAQETFYWPDANP